MTVLNLLVATMSAPLLVGLAEIRSTSIGLFSDGFETGKTPQRSAYASCEAYNSTEYGSSPC